MQAEYQPMRKKTTIRAQDVMIETDERLLSEVRVLKIHIKNGLLRCFSFTVMAILHHIQFRHHTLFHTNILTTHYIISDQYLTQPYIVSDQ